MADDKKIEKKSLQIDSWNYWLIGVFVVIFIFVGITTGSGLLGIFVSPDVNSENPDGSVFSSNGLLGKEKLTVDMNIAAVKELQVRNAPGGSIIGLQKKLSEGKIMEGPINQFDTFWWRVNFYEIPSGWVENGSITSKTKTLKFINLPSTIYNGYKPIGYVLSILLFIAFLYLSVKYNEEVVIGQKKLKMRDEQAEKDIKEEQKATREDLGLPVQEEEEYSNSRWEHVKGLMESKNQSDWRQAIIEADIILDEMLRRMSYKGLTIGDMLKEVEPSDFVTLDKAWEAHKFRNEIAHTGSEFRISKEEAERVIELFQAVFDEFYYV